MSVQPLPYLLRYFLLPPWYLGFYMMHCVMPLFIISGACLDRQVFLPHFFDIFVDKNWVGNVRCSYFIDISLCPIWLTTLQKDMITYSTTDILVNELQEVFGLVIWWSWILRTTCPCPCIDINLPAVISWWTPSNCLVICILWNTFTHYLVSATEQFPCLSYLTYLKTAQTSLVFEVWPQQAELVICES